MGGVAGLPEQTTRWFELTLRLAIAALFVYAGAAKALDTAEFERAIAGFRLIPPWIEGATAMYLPWLEIVCGLGLLWRRTVLGAAPVLGVLTTVFILAVASAWWRGLDISCGCFGSTDVANYPWLITRNVLIVAAIGALFIADMMRLAKKPDTA